ncbi:protein FANTASTIC FOUR 1 [Mercurialis annua]|uniref:protein FANTASTIC FOUR 1 n=1 Tax=Mercurialis annua TaxID=3986 RepID=UPI00215ECEE9|nr:protein FANTASTIC FOUR 1 [Mercurialis annua]
MMSFCKKSVHSFLGLTISPMNNSFDILDHSKPLKTSGLGLITATDIHTSKSPPNVLESTTFKSPSPSPPSPPPPPPPAAPPLFKKDPGGVGFIDYVGGGCTESLGFESCDERRVDDESDELCSRTSTTATTRVTNNWRKNNIRERKEVKKFPPPLSSLNHNGQPSFYLRPVRKNGRLELTEVRIDRPEILRASREDGRLRLHLIRDDDEEEDNDCIKEIQEQECEHQENQELIDIQEEEVQENQEMEDEQEEEVQENQEEEVQENQEMEHEQEEEVQENDDEEEEIAGEWRFPVTGEGFRRCHELGAHHHRNDYHHHHHPHQHHHHHHNMHVWRQHCVTTR